jgi:two-component system sensor histidine kinase DesK
MSADQQPSRNLDEPPRFRRGLLFAGAWLIFLAEPVAAGFNAHPGLLARAAVLATAVAFGSAYLVALMTGVRSLDGHPAGKILIPTLGVLVVLLSLLAGQSALVTLVYVAVAGMVHLPANRRWAWAFALVVLAAAVPAVVPGWKVTAAQPLSVALGTMTAFGVIAIAQRNRELLAARDEMARLAIVEERLRFSRDLHDILGHSSPSRRS